MSVEVEGGKLKTVSGDKDNPDSQGFLGARIPIAPVAQSFQLGDKPCDQRRPRHQRRDQNVLLVRVCANGNVRAAREFSGHASIEVLMRYDDNRKDVGGEVASKVIQRLAKLFGDGKVRPAGDRDE
jgi:hypothetical protein